MKPIRAPALSPTQPAADRPHVLYVEDDDQNWEVADLRLSSRYALHRARNDQEAFAFIRAYGSTLGVILMDIQLADSKLTGIEITRALRGMPLDKPVPEGAPGPIDTPILFVTAAGAEYSQPYLLAQGGNDLITKPVDFTKLNLAMARACLQKVSAIVGAKPST